MSFMAPGGAPKRDSIFSSIAPAQPAAAPMPAPAQAPAPRPTVDAEAVNALKAKIDLLEKNIVAQLEKKLAEPKSAAPAPLPPPPPAPPLQDLLLGKIENLERRLSDSAAISSSQLRNIEESKISARREIEDLLKAVREQQKYSELDRQMHDQMEKAWTRAEALEKKLMDFYSSILQMEGKRQGDAVLSSDRSAAALDALSARLLALEQRLTGSASSQQMDALREGQEKLRLELDARLKEVSAGMPSSEKLLSSQNEFFARLERERRESLAAQAELAKETRDSLKQSEASFRDVFDNYMRSEFKLLQDRIAAEAGEVRRESASAAAEIKAAADAQARAYAASNEDLRSMLKENRLRADGVESSLETSARRQALALEEFARRMDAELRAVNSEHLSASKREADERFAKFGAKYADAMLSLTFVESFRSAVSAALDRLEGHESRMKDFLTHVQPSQLERLTGVSGEVVRRHFDALAADSKGLGGDISALREVKREVERKFGNIFGDEK